MAFLPLYEMKSKTQVEPSLYEKWIQQTENYYLTEAMCTENMEAIVDYFDCDEIK